MEVLISMFILLFGLMGVAAIFPVGNHYVVQGEKFDRGNTLAANAFEEIRARGMLNPEAWVYAGVSARGLSTPGTGTEDVIDPNSGTFNIPLPPRNNPRLPGPGHAFVIDPMSSASAWELGNRTNLDAWPQYSKVGMINADNRLWVGFDRTIPITQIDGGRWPARRVTLRIPDPNGSPYQQMTSPVAETIFRLRDDLAVELPERDDYPGILRWNTNGTQLLTRQYQGNFSWLATVVPLTLDGREALQPAVREHHPYEVSVVVFYKRVDAPQPETERQIDAEMLPGGELVMYGTGTATTTDVDDKFEDVKSGDWVCVMGINETTGVFLLKWYRLLALDEEAYEDGLDSQSGSFPQRRAMLLGPDWPIPTTGPNAGFAGRLRVAIFPGVASAVTREMVLQTGTLWD